MTTLNPNGDVFHRINMQPDGMAGNSFFVDDVRLVTGN